MIFNYFNNNLFLINNMTLNEEQECEKLFEDMIGNNIGLDSHINDVYKRNSKKYLIYQDFTASGKGLKSIESFITNEILPTYANVHSTVGLCAERTAKFFEQSKNILREYTNAYGNYSIIFHGQGATGGVHKLIEILSIKKYVSFYKNLKTAFNIKEKIKEKDNDTTFINLCQDLINEIENQFIELFVNINFCFKFKEKDKNITKCILCNKEFENEGGYYQHLNDKLHKKNLKNYDNSENSLFKYKGKKGINDFIDIIKQTYYNKRDIINKNSYLLKLINDYKKFKPIIFYSLFEHNSNSLSWKEEQCDIILINPLDTNNFIINLENELIKNKERYIKIGSFTACSNITGLLLDVDSIASLMHKYGGFAFFDYASGGPYLQMNVSGPLPDNYRKLLGFDELSQDNKKYCFKDGLFFSPHKFIGGPCTPGVLIVHDRIHRNLLKPSQPGGGTVHYVYKNYIKYIQDVELKEESGTPNIIGSIRLGLMIKVRQKISHEFIIKKDEEYNKLFVEKLKDNPNLYILHNKYLKNRPHLPIFSFMISYGNKFLHPNYVCALLNDFFGIQSRPGCSCAPNYGAYLLGFDKDKNSFEAKEKLILSGYEIFKPGYCRLNLPYFYPKYIIEYIIKAIKFICKYGHLFLGLYEFEVQTGKFYLYNSKTNILDLNHFNFDEIKNTKLFNDNNYKKVTSDDLNILYRNLMEYIKNNSFLKETFTQKQNKLIPNVKDYKFGEIENSRWFLLFKDVENLLKALYKFKIMKTKDDNLIDYLEEEAINKNKKMNDWSIIF